MSAKYLPVPGTGGVNFNDQHGACGAYLLDVFLGRIFKWSIRHKTVSAWGCSSRARDLS